MESNKNYSNFIGNVVEDEETIVRDYTKCAGVKIISKKKENASFCVLGNVKITDDIEGVDGKAIHTLIQKLEKPNLEMICTIGFAIITLTKTNNE